ncbi:MAG: MBL fold metallo-hydrolase [Burkholderiaceae bacterium]
MSDSPRWRDGLFRNLQPILPGLRVPGASPPTAREFLRTGPPRTPQRPLPAADPRAAWAATPDSGLRITWLGHSTMLIEIDGVRLLTDPVWGHRASPFRLLGPARFQPVPVRLRNLPPVDAVLISHDHYDHLDYPTIRTLARHTNVPMITSLGVGAHLEAWGVAPARIRELDWWESHHLAGTGIEITAAPSQHFSGRGIGSRNSTLWSSFAIRSGRHSVFFSGDTGLSPEYRAIAERLGPFDVVMLEVGAWHPSWGDMHLGPVNALQARDWLGGGLLLPIHWGTFCLAMHAWDEPAETLLALAGSSGAGLLMPRLGEAVEPAHGPRTLPWWRDAQDSRGVGHPAVPPTAVGPDTDAIPDEAKTSQPPDDQALARSRELPWPLD